mmetsp:Transcript_54730/g.169875  ORF Transcript_54730/g.169875 Transcript_54730/m.169875 type:complete len:330 (-) Transcript_54730:162-1151(-)
MRRPSRLLQGGGAEVAPPPPAARTQPARRTALPVAAAGATPGTGIPGATSGGAKPAAGTPGATSSREKSRHCACIERRALAMSSPRSVQSRDSPRSACCLSAAVSCDCTSKRCSPACSSPRRVRARKARASLLAASSRFACSASVRNQRSWSAICLCAACASTRWASASARMRTARSCCKTASRRSSFTRSCPSLWRAASASPASSEPLALPMCSRQPCSAASAWCRNESPNDASSRHSARSAEIAEACGLAACSRASVASRTAWICCSVSCNGASCAAQISAASLRNSCSSRRRPSWVASISLLWSSTDRRACRNSAASRRPWRSSAS